MFDDETGKSKCFGFVSYRDHDQAEKAVENMNGKEVDGKVNLFISLYKFSSKNLPFFTFSFLLLAP